eukprot:9548693-Lingulodinium_polyedra.AAC.1
MQLVLLVFYAGLQRAIAQPAFLAAFSGIRYLRTTVALRCRAGLTLLAPGLWLAPSSLSVSPP